MPFLREMILCEVFLEAAMAVSDFLAGVLGRGIFDKSRVINFDFRDDV